LAGAGRADRQSQRRVVDGLHEETLVVTAGAYFPDVALIPVVGRRVIEDEAVNTVAIDGVQLGAACGAFGHWQTPEAVWETKNAPAKRRRRSRVEQGGG